MPKFYIATYYFCGWTRMKSKKATVKDDGNLMFSQRNNPYCELLQFCSANVNNIS